MRRIQTSAPCTQLPQSFNVGCPSVQIDPFFLTVAWLNKSSTEFGDATLWPQQRDTVCFVRYKDV